MKYIFNIFGHACSMLLKLAVFVSPKARMMVRGRRKVRQRLREGIVPGRRYMWIHAASLGEFEQGRPFIETIRKRCPDLHIVLSFFSSSGYEVRKDYDHADVVVYLPADRLARVRMFLNLIKPEMAVFIKYDFWPCFLSELKNRAIPTYLISAAFRPGQLFFRPYGKPYRNLLHCFTKLYVQDNESRTLLARYGINNVVAAGDTRFDRVIEISRQAKELPLIRRWVAAKEDTIIVAGSSWPPDEELLIRYFNDRPGVRLIIAPHTIDNSRLLQIISYIKRPCIRLSEASADNIERQDCLIIDSFGLLSSTYRFGHIAYIGGGFGNGIHNCPEAAVYGLPIVFGPRFEKFIEARGLINAGGAFSIRSGEEFNTLLDSLCTDTVRRENGGRAARDYVHRYAGATDRIISDILGR